MIYEKRRMWQETWFWEQAVLVVLLATAIAWQVLPAWRQGGVWLRVATMAALTGALTLAGQKVRSMADRQAERNGAEVKNAPMSCADKVRRWAIVSQGMSVVASAVGAPTPAHVAVAAYVIAYPYWRRWYRARRPYGRDKARVVGRLGVAGVGPVSPRRLVPLPVHIVPLPQQGTLESALGKYIGAHHLDGRKLPDVGSYVDVGGRTVRWWHTRAMRAEDCAYCIDGCCEQRIESCEAWQADVVLHARPRRMHA